MVHPSSQLFVGRSAEFKLLDELYASSKSEFLVLYGRRRVVFIDEFTCIMAADPTLASNLQRSWDAVLENANLFLCISDSHLGMMVRGILSGTAPLYGRAARSSPIHSYAFITASFMPG